MFLKVKYCSLSNKLIPPCFQDILVLGKHFPTYIGMCISQDSQEDVVQFIRGCIFWCTNKTSNRKQILCHLLHIPIKPYDIISMDFMGGFPTTRKGHNYMFVVVYRFIKMCIIMPCKNTIKGQEEANMLFERV